MSNHTYATLISIFIRMIQPIVMLHLLETNALYRAGNDRGNFDEVENTQQANVQKA